jgi:hypothetical protein
MKRSFNIISAAILIVLCNGLCFSQKQTNNWYFGINAGLSFNSNPPVVLTNGALNTTEGSAVMSDSNGNLLFYTDGVNVWNNTHSVMPNGTGLQGDVSTTQSALIIKKPGSSTLYYIFTLPAEGVGNFCYSVVDMTLDSGKGDITTKNTVLKNTVTEKLSAVLHCNGVDIWVMIHELGSNKFYAYPVTSAGVGTPVVSTTGRVYTRVHGQMKFSSNAAKLACIRDTLIANGPPYQGKAYLDIHNFNNQTGVVTHTITLNLNNWQKSYGVEFSPDNSKIYATYYDQSGLNAGNSELIQYNLTSTAVAASGVTVGSSLDPQILRAMQLGPDGKIYISKSNSPFLCVINSPNSIGSASNYSDNAIDVDVNSVGAGCMLGLPGFMQSYFNPLFPDIFTCPTNTNTAGIAEINPGIDTRFFYNDYSNTLKIFGLNTEQQYEVRIYNTIGKLVFESTIDRNNNSTDFSLNLPELPPGVYVTRISGDNRTATGRFFRP